ncbi:MAG TPA: oligosaccharide flippase family protein [Rubrobacteraceae bacterium]|nr:oligosaccharide flippase family protein [Rubrobacteraceae bacterium]
MKNFLSAAKGRQGAGAGSLYIAFSFAVSGALTFGFQSLAAHALGKAGYAPLALLWSSTFLVVQVLWIGATQTLGRYIAEREAKGQDWRPVIRSVKRWQIGLSGAFVLVALPISPWLTGLFGDPWLTVVFVVSMVAYAPEYFRRGIFNGHHQSSRLGAQILAESAGRLLIAAALLAAGMGVLGPAIAILLAPIIGVLAVRPAPAEPPEHEGEPFSAMNALKFAGPVLTCVAFAQVLMNGGPILVSVLGGTPAQVGLFGAAMILTRIPQYIISPAIGALLPHASRILSTGGYGPFGRFVGRAVGVVGLVGVLMVGATWLLGEWGIKLFAGSEFDASREMLVTLAAVAAFYLLCDMLNQALFALGHARLASLGWLVGLVVSALCLAILDTDVLSRVSYSLAIGTLAAAMAQAAFYLMARRSATVSRSG